MRFNGLEGVFGGLDCWGIGSYDGAGLGLSGAILSTGDGSGCVRGLKTALSGRQGVQADT